MKRRGFLGLMVGAIAAPAIVKAENIMKIVVPKKEIILLPHPLAFGTMVWKPELVMVVPVSRNPTSELRVQPAFNHVADLPALITVGLSHPRVMNAAEIVEHSKLFPHDPMSNWLDNEWVTERFRYEPATIS